jgi:hypothetical protein
MINNEQLGCGLRSLIADVARSCVRVAMVFFKERLMDTTTLLIIIVIVLLVGGGGWYGRGRWY